MVARTTLIASILIVAAVSRATADTPADSARVMVRDTLSTVRADTVRAVRPDTVRRVVREFPTVEVRSLLHDLKSSQTVHPIPAVTLRALPIDGLVDVIALQPGVVAQGEELHVRGGRAGETRVVLDGLTLNEPQRQRAMEVPLLAVREAEIVSGTPEARFAGATAGVIDLHTFDPGERFSGEWRWLTDARTDTHFDRLGARVSSPLHVAGLGVVAAGDATLDDTWLPMLRRPSRHRILGRSIGWRADNRMLGMVKLAPIEGPRRFTAQLLASRKVREPYDPAWTADGWVGMDSFGLPVFSPDEQPGFVRYRAADHNVTSDERMLGATVTLASLPRTGGRSALALGWLRTRTLTAAAGVFDTSEITLPYYNTGASGDPFYEFGGDFPLFRRSASDVLSLRADIDRVTPRGMRFAAGAGATYESVEMNELDATLLDVQQFKAQRHYRAFAPGAFAYGQARWEPGEMVVNAGLRTEWWTPGPQAGEQTFPATSRGRLLFSPRIGLGFPISSRDVISFAYNRLNQPPPRDVLYDDRTQITNRQPLGNAGVRPALMVSYEAALKRLLTPRSALQASVFFREAARLTGAREYTVPSGRSNLLYTDEDQASSAGLEVSWIQAPDEGRRIEVHYTLMQAWGYESRPEGDPYGPTREVRATPIAEEPLSWDRRHALAFVGVQRWKRWSWAWSTLIGAPLPWTPKPFRQQITDLSIVNSRRFEWTETTNFNAQFSPRYALGLTFGVEARNLFNTRAERAVTVDGYPNPSINTVFDDYGAWRTETGERGGAYWSTAGGTGHWVPVHDPRLLTPPRTLRVSVGRTW